MSEPSDDPPPPRAERTYDTEGDSTFDSRFDSAEADRRAEEDANRRRRTTVIVVLLATLLPIAFCGFAFLICSFVVFRR